jgi:DNA polymerase-3 subunit delta'
MSALGTTSIWDRVIGQEQVVANLTRALAEPVHAYLFVGPHGSTKHQAARAFAAGMISGGTDPTQRDARLVLDGEHPDCREVERVGAAIDKEQAEWIVEQAWLSPAEGDVKVLILHEFHLLADTAAGRLLKTIEEPPASTRFIITAESVPPDLVTIASRCVRIDFRAIPDEVILDRLLAEGIDADTARLASTGALGDLDRARVLATDPALAERRRVFAEALHTLDGSGFAAFGLVAEIEALIEAAAEPLKVRHVAEAEELQERIERLGARGSGRKQLEDRHKREVRRFVTDELRAGLTTLAGAYRDAMVAGRISADDTARAVGAINTTIGALGRNANSTLALQRLVWSLPLPR